MVGPGSGILQLSSHVSDERLSATQWRTYPSRANNFRKARSLAAESHVTKWTVKHYNANISFCRRNVLEKLIKVFFSLRTNRCAIRIFAIAACGAFAIDSFFLIAALKTLNRLNKEGEALALQDDLTTHPTLALMRRILADAQVTPVNSKWVSQYTGWTSALFEEMTSLLLQCVNTGRCYGKLYIVGKITLRSIY